MIGVLDWGIGGIGILKLLKEKYPDVPTIYLSDTGSVPYGKLSRRDLTARIETAADHLERAGIDHLIIGCNAASTAIPHMQKRAIEITGVIEPAIKASIAQRPTRLGVIGGRRTILSGVYRRGFATYGIVTEQRIAQPLSALIESGELSSDRARYEARRILRPLRNCSHILLACTHYPAIEHVLSEFVSPATKFIDPAAALVRTLRLPSPAAASEYRFITTGDAQGMRTAAMKAWNFEIGKITSIRLAD